MNKTEYMNTLRRELEGLPAELIEDTLWTYEGKFVDGMVAGQTEEEIAAKLPTPQLVAAQKRANLRLTTLKNDFSPSNLLSLLVATLGVLVFNLLMVFPAVVYTAMLFSAYATSLAFYFAGIIMTAASTRKPPIPCARNTGRICQWPMPAAPSTGAAMCTWSACETLGGAK